MKTNRKMIKAPWLSVCFVYPILLVGVAGHACMAQSAGTFTSTGPLITPRAGHTATLLLNGKVLIAGGYRADDPFASVESAELYDPSTGAFTATGNMMNGIYDPSSGAFTATGDTVTRQYPGAGATATLLPDGRVFFGGQATTLLRDGRVFIAGYPTAELYDPVTNTFAATVPYAAPAPAIMERSTLLADGRVLLTGAVNICFQPLCRDPGTSWTELFDPAAGTFSLTGSMKGYNNIYTATLLTDGKVLFVGNDTYNGVPPSAEVFDPSDETFTAIEPPSASHEYGAATLLPDGTVLITGGLVPGGNEQVMSELYVPEGGTFSPAVNMIKGHLLHTSTLLADGTVLIAGSRVDAPLLSSAELYHPVMLVPAPLLFSLSGDGRGQGAIWHAATGQVVSPGAPAVAGEILSMYTTSLGHGSVIPPQVAIGGRLAEILFFGSAPGYPGFNQVNVRMPGGIAPGPAIPVRLTYLGRPSNEVTIAVQ
jgi:Galactose oxidase, central domain